MCSAIQRFEDSYPANTGFQYGSPVLPRSIAAPTAGMCDVVRPAVILAMALFRPVGLAAVALRRAPAGDHHRFVVVLRHARHLRREVLERKAVGRADLREEVDV